MTRLRDSVPPVVAAHPAARTPQAPANDTTPEAFDARLQPFVDALVSLALADLRRRPVAR